MFYNGLTKFRGVLDLHRGQQQKKDSQIREIWTDALSQIDNVLMLEVRLVTSHV